MYLLHSEFDKKNPYLKCMCRPISTLAIELHLVRFGLSTFFTFKLHCSLPSTPSLLLFHFTYENAILLHLASLNSKKLGFTLFLLYSHMLSTLYYSSQGSHKYNTKYP